MPTELLLPAFALTLLANAILVAVAIRALRRGRSDRETDGSRAVANVPSQVDRHHVPAAPIADAPPDPIDAGRDTDPVGPKPRVTRTPSAKPAGPTAPARPRSAAGPMPAASPTPAAPDASSSRPKRRHQGPSAKAEDKPGQARSGNRRRFSLPPLDDDDERVSRSIESFLSSADSADVGDGSSGAPVATTVAIVVVDGLELGARSGDEAAFEVVTATVHRTLRGAARAADRVTSTGPGRFRVVLPATGELAARAYLRGVRATVEPSFEAATVSLRLLTATATVLDDTPAAATALAQARLDTAVANLRRRMPDEEPRAAGD